MVQWTPKTEAGNAENQEAARLLRWLCGTWRDQKGSTYRVSMADSGSISLVTTRPSAEVISTIGLIRADPSKPGRVVWGKAAARLLYVLDKRNQNTLRWRSGGSGGSFDWERQDFKKESDSETEEGERKGRWRSGGSGGSFDSERQERQSSETEEEERKAVGERRARLRREFRECRDALRCGQGSALKEVVGVSVAAKAQKLEPKLPEAEKDATEKLFEFNISSIRGMPCHHAEPLMPTLDSFQYQWDTQLLHQHLQFSASPWDLWNVVTPYDLEMMAFWGNSPFHKCFDGGMETMLSVR